MDHGSTPPPPPDPSGAGAPASTGGLGARFAARLLDALIVGLAASVVLGLLGLPAPTFGLGGLGAWTHSAVTALAWFGYYVYSESTSGATLGKRLLKLRVVGEDGQPASSAAAAKRNVWILFGLVPWIGGLAQLVTVIVIAVTISSSAANRGKHDEIAGTIVTA